MGTEDDTITLLGRALDQTAGVIAAIRTERAALPTPCSEWDVQALVRHLIGQDLRNFLVSARGETADWQAPAGQLGEDWAGEFRAGAQRLLEAWRTADLDRPVAMPGGGQAPLRSRLNHQITELTVHDWDLVQATGQQTDLDPALAERSLAWSRKMLRPEARGPDKAFGAEVPVPPGGSSYDRLAGWFGRDPGWKPPPE